MTKRIVLYILPVFLLAAIFTLIFVNYKRRKDMIWVVICRTNLHSIGNAFTVYYYSDKQWPSDKRWCDALIKDADLHERYLQCPCATNSKCNYAINEYLWGKDLDEAEPKTVLIFESTGGWNNVGGREILETKNHNSPGSNIMFADGRIEFITADRIKELSWGKDEEK